MNPKWVSRLHVGFAFLYVLSLFITLSGMELFSTLLLIPVAFGWFDKKSFSIKNVPPLFYPIVLFILVMWMGTLFSDSPFREKLYDMQRARFFGIYFILFFAFRDFQEKRILKWILWPVAFLCIYGTAQHFLGPIDLFRPEGKKVLMYAIPEEKIGPLVVGTFNHHLSFSNMFMLYGCILFSLGFILKRKCELFLGSWVFILCVWTESRAAWATIPIVLGIILYQKGKKWFWAGMGVTALLFTLVYFSDHGFQQRFNRTVFENDAFYSIQSDNPRMRLWNAQIKMFLDHPLIGVGWNNNERKSKEYVDKLYGESPSNFYGHAHSEFFQILSSTGLLGLVLFLSIWYLVFKMCFTLWKKASDEWSRTFYFGVMVALISFQIQGLTQWNFGDAEVLHSIVFLWALIAARHSQLNVASLDH